MGAWSRSALTRRPLDGPVEPGTGIRSLARALADLGETGAKAAAPSNLAQQIGQLCRLDGDFRLRSGTTATTYFDKYLFEADPAILRAVAEKLSQLVPADTDVLAGLELGGVPVVTALSLATGVPAAFVRKVAKLISLFTASDLE